MRMTGRLEGFHQTGSGSEARARRGGFFLPCTKRGVLGPQTFFPGAYPSLSSSQLSMTPRPTLTEPHRGETSPFIAYLAFPAKSRAILTPARSARQRAGGRAGQHGGGSPRVWGFRGIPTGHIPVFPAAPGLSHIPARASPGTGGAARGDPRGPQRDWAGPPPRAGLGLGGPGGVLGGLEGVCPSILNGKRGRRRGGSPEGPPCTCPAGPCG